MSIIPTVSKIVKTPLMKQFRIAKKNEMVIGGDLYEIIKKKSQFKFKNVKGHNIGFRQTYPVYAVSKVKSIDLI